MQPATYQTAIGHDFQPPDCPPQSVSVPDNADADKVTRYIQHHTDQVDQWRQMVNAEDILKQKILESLDENYFKRQRQAYINYANHTLAGLIQNLYNDNWTISTIYIEDSELKMKQEWLLLDPMVDLI